jgi:hypothetical protein
VVADVNRDGHIDLITTDLAGAALAVLEGAGDGTFRLTRPIAVDASPMYLATGGLNGDRRPDRVVSHQSGVVSVLVSATARSCMRSWAADRPWASPARTSETEMICSGSLHLVI